jgi:hypothetical protein
VTSEGTLEVQLTEVLDELITLVQETKQAEWSTSSTDETPLDDLMDFLRTQVLAISEADERLTGGPPSILSPSARRPRNLAAEAGGNTDRLLELLVADLDDVARDVRSREGSVDTAWSDRLEALAVGLERSASALRTHG